MSNKLKCGYAYSFSYRRYNYEGLPEKTEVRRVLVTSIRDTKRNPLDPRTIELNPTLLRGRWLVTGQDLDKGVERSFYAKSMQDVRQIDQDEQPIGEMEYAVVDRERVTFTCRTFLEASAYLLGRRRGVLCGVLSRKSISRSTVTEKTQ